MKNRTVLLSLFIMVAAVSAVMITQAVYAADAATGGAVESIMTAEGANWKSRALMTFAAMGAVGISCMVSAYALARIGSAAFGAMSEKPELGGRALIFLGLAEGIAIYGLIVAIMILNKI